MEKVKLGEIAKVITKGTTPTSIGYKFENAGVNFVKIESISEIGEFLNDKFSHISKECNDKLSRSKLCENDVLFSIAGAIGRVAIVKKEILPANTNQAIAIIRIDDRYDKLFLKYLFTSNYIKKQYNRKKQGVAQINLSLKDISELEIPVLGLKEQSKIANRLDKVQKIIDIRKRQIEQLDELVKSQFVDMFGDVIKNEKGFTYKRIDEVSTIITGTTPDTTNGDFWNGNIRWITPTEINMNTFFIEDTERKITENGRKSKSLLLMPVGTVLFTSRAPIGKTAIAGIEMCCNQGFKNCICNNEINNIYLYSVLKYNAEYLDSLGTGATFRELSKSNFSKIQISVPPIELQNQFADIVKQINKQKLELQKSLEELQKLQESLMNKYFG